MLEPYDLKKAKIDSLVTFFTNSGYRSSNRIGQIELLQFLSKRAGSGRFDQILSEKLFQVLNLDHMSTITIEDFINGFIQFEEDIRRNAEIFNINLNKEQEIYNSLVEQCRRYKMEKLNEEGMCENAKVYGEITDIDIKKKLEGIKEIIIKVIYNDKSEELHFKMGDINSNELLKKSFGFKPTSRKDHFEFIMKGINDRNQTFDIGSKVFPLDEVNSNEEYIVQIQVPELDNETEIAAFIHAKIVIYWSDYKYYERLRKKAESRLKKLISATNKASQYLKLVREIYGDLTRKKPDLIVDFNNEKLMQRKGAKINVNFNNQKEADAPGGNYLVEFNNLKEVRKTVEPIKVEFNNSKEVIQTIKEEKIKEVVPPPVINQQIEVNQTRVYTQTNPPIYQTQNLPFISKVEEEKNVEYQTIPAEQINTNYSYLQQTQTETNLVQNGNLPDYKSDLLIQQSNGAEAITNTTENIQYNEYNQTNYANGQQNDMIMAETVGYGSYDTQGNVQAYGTGGYELIDNNTQLAQLRNSEIIKQEEIRTSVNKAMINESTKKALFSQTTLPVKVLETTVKEPIIDSNVKTLPLIYGRKSITYGDSNQINNYNINNVYRSEQLNQVYTLEGQGNNGLGNIAYSTNV